MVVEFVGERRLIVAHLEAALGDSIFEGAVVTPVDLVAVREVQAEAESPFLLPKVARQIEVCGVGGIVEFFAGRGALEPDVTKREKAAAADFRALNLRKAAGIVVDRTGCVGLSDECFALTCRRRILVRVLESQRKRRHAREHAHGKDNRCHRRGLC